jgi:hypothetical protein
MALGSTQKYFLVDKGGRGVGLEIWEPQPPGTLRICPGPIERLNRTIQKSKGAPRTKWIHACYGVRVLTRYEF